MNRDFAKELLTSKRELLSKILAFNRSSDSTDLSSSYPMLAQALEGNYHLKRKLGNTTEFYCDFESLSNRLVLLPQDIFSPLEKLLSACICSDLLQAGILQRQVKLYKDILGESNYYFGLGRGRFYLGTALKNKIIRQFVSPDEAISRSGVWCLGLCASQASDFCKEKLELSDAKSVDHLLEYTADEYHNLNLCIAKIIVKEIDPACQSILR